MKTSQPTGANLFTSSRRFSFMGGGALLLGLVSGRFKVVSLAEARTNDIGIVAGEGDQREWRFCEKCFSMFYNGDPQGRRGACAAGGAHQAQGFNFALHYSHSRRQPVPARDSQYEWRFCSKCFSMFYEGGDGLGVCPVVTRDREFRDNRHLPYGFIFGLPHDNPANPGQPDWRFCSKCFGLFFDDPNNTNKGRCPAGAAHVRASNSFNFQLPFTNEWLSGTTSPPAPPTITVATVSPNNFHVTGSRFVPGHSVGIRVVGDALNAEHSLTEIRITTIGERPIMTDQSGNLDVTLNGLCRSTGHLNFSVSDGRTLPTSVDATGFLWTKPVPVACT